MKKLLYVAMLAFSISACDKSPVNPDAVIPDNINYQLGNPSAATTDITNPDNLLIEKDQFVLSYNNSRGTANWVSWNLSEAWLGDTPRSNSFHPDTDLPASYYKVSTGDYTGSGFDRGHLCPSADRNKTDADNYETFAMTNIMPQTPNNNQITWASLENYSRDLVRDDDNVPDGKKELFIIAGGYGKGGSGSNGGTTNTLSNGRITVPKRTWKVIAIIDADGDDSNNLEQINSNTRIIAVDMPNMQNIAENWGQYRVSVDEIEAMTGFDFLSNLNQELQTSLEAEVDNGPTN